MFFSALTLPATTLLNPPSRRPLFYRHIYGGIAITLQRVFAEFERRIYHGMKPHRTIRVSLEEVEELPRGVIAEDACPRDIYEYILAGDSPEEEKSHGGLHHDISMA